ncbi:hypothetical protein MKX03_008444 [Papaver bracteatum]|nr:hypothetical protein MKX03_008444 [Papaver bracteatum]
MQVVVKLAHATGDGSASMGEPLIRTRPSCSLPTTTSQSPQELPKVDSSTEQDNNSGRSSTGQSKVGVETTDDEPDDTDVPPIRTSPQRSLVATTREAQQEVLKVQYLKRE